MMKLYPRFSYTPTFIRRKMMEKVGRNDPCPCGSGKKYKQCCLTKNLKKPLHKRVSVISQSKGPDLLARNFSAAIERANVREKKEEPEKPVE